MDKLQTIAEDAITSKVMTINLEALIHDKQAADFPGRRCAQWPSAPTLVEPKNLETASFPLCANVNFFGTFLCWTRASLAGSDLVQ